MALISDSFGTDEDKMHCFCRLFLELPPARKSENNIQHEWPKSQQYMKLWSHTCGDQYHPHPVCQNILLLTCAKEGGSLHKKRGGDNHSMSLNWMLKHFVSLLWSHNKASMTTSNSRTKHVLITQAPRTGASGAPEMVSLPQHKLMIRVRSATVYLIDLGRSHDKNTYRPSATAWTASLQI